MSVHENKLQKRLRRQVGRAIEDYQMIEEGDRIMVCISGGKDSYTMLDILLSLQKSAPVSFELLAVNLDQHQPGFPAEILPNYLQKRNIPYRILSQDTYSIVQEKISPGQTMCSLCSRLRRGALYTFARHEGYNKLALGHHRFDILETFFLNLFFNGQLKTMPAKLRNDEGDLLVIRPLAYCDERDISRYAEMRQFPLIPCNLCGSQPNLQRQVIKNMLLTWDSEHPRRLDNIFAALGRVAPSHLLDRELFDFQSISAHPHAAPQLWLPRHRCQEKNPQDIFDQALPQAANAQEESQ